MLVELGLLEPRKAGPVSEVLDGATVVDVARRNGVARQSVHDWLRAYASKGAGRSGRLQLQADEEDQSPGQNRTGLTG